VKCGGHSGCARTCVIWVAALPAPGRSPDFVIEPYGDKTEFAAFSKMLRERRALAKKALCCSLELVVSAVVGTKGTYGHIPARALLVMHTFALCAAAAAR
jgi:hypothetical protein